MATWIPEVGPYVPADGFNEAMRHIDRLAIVNSQLRNELSARNHELARVQRRLHLARVRVRERRREVAELRAALEGVLSYEDCLRDYVQEYGDTEEGALDELEVIVGIARSILRPASPSPRGDAS